ncbi:MAG: hypothetical protein KDE59_16330 [Anaerolineales bacterium]|nr:hypothetical protein [Anaerolineales bacterium]MCB8961696.1 hypothetical protein [Ardenticatenales bacterium]
MKILKGLVLLLAGGVVVLVVAGVVGYFMLDDLPQITVLNQCDEAIPLPPVPTIPDSIPVGGTATFPVIFGSGTYSLYEEEGLFKVTLPRSLPGFGDTVTVSQSFADPDATFQGQQVTIPMQATVEMGQTYDVAICTE